MAQSSEQNSSAQPPEIDATVSNEKPINREISGIESRLEERLRLRDQERPKSADPERVAMRRSGEAKWREEADKGNGHLRNERGHYTTMDLEHQRAIIDNKLFDEAKKYDVIIRDLQRVLELLRELRDYDEVQKISNSKSEGINEPEASGAESPPKNAFDPAETAAGISEDGSAEGAYTEGTTESGTPLTESTDREPAETAAGISEDGSAEGAYTEGATESGTPLTESTDREPAETAAAPYSTDTETPIPTEPALPGDYEPEPTESEPTPLYTPSYRPETPTYVPSPDIEPFKADFIRRVTEIARRDQERAIERYGGFRPFGALSGFLRLASIVRIPFTRIRPFAGAAKLAEPLEAIDQRISKGQLGRAMGIIRGWFDKVGHRNVLDDEQIEDEAMFEENMRVAGRFQKRPWWKKVLKIGAKTLGGFGVAGATILTGGVGAVTALLWSGGLKEGYDGIAQTVEHFVWGNRRGAAELNRQTAMQNAIDNLRKRIIDNDPTLTRDEYITRFREIYDLERQLMDQELENIGGERRGQFIRSITTSALTIGTGLLGGVPIGEVNYDTDNTQMAETFRQATVQPDLQVMDQSHRGIWNLIHGGQFEYGHENLMSAVKDSLNGKVPSGAEHADMTTIISYLERLVGGEWPLTELAPYGQTAHELGNAFAVADWLKVGSPIPYLIGECLRHRAHRPGDEADYYKRLGLESDHGPSYYAEGGAPYTPGPVRDEARGLPEELRVPPKDSDESIERERKSAESYFSFEETAHGSREALDDIEKFAEKMPPMHKSCRVSICVPAAYSEHRIIRGYLESLKGQQNIDGSPLDPDKYEIIIFVNGLNDKQDEINKTVSEIEAFKQDNPDIRIHTISKSYPEAKPIGYLRKIINDLAIKRSIERTEQDGPLYLVSHDADTIVVDPQYISKSIETLDSNYEIKILAGASNYDDETRKKYPFVWVARRMWQFIDEFRTGKQHGDMTRKAMGNNSVIRAEAYARVGGFDPNTRVAEDLTLARRITEAYANGNEPREKKPVANLGMKVVLSARRDIQAVEEGKSIIRGYDDFHDNQRVREELRAPNAESITPDNEEQFLAYLRNEATAQFNNLFIEQFWVISDKSPEIVQARSKGASNEQIKQIQNRQMQGDIGKEALRNTEVTFRKACDYLGIRTKVLPARDGKYQVEIINWDILKRNLAEKMPK